jgi:hypothetical protein
MQMSRKLKDAAKEHHSKPYDGKLKREKHADKAT